MECCMNECTCYEAVTTEVPSIPEQKCSCSMQSSDGQKETCAVQFGEVSTSHSGLTEIV